MAHTNTWDASYEADPADSDPVSEGAAKIRGDKKDTRERIAKDHYMDIGGTDADHGEHSKITLHAPISTPADVANKGFIYGKNVGAKIELHYLDEDDNELQLSSAGSLGAATEDILCNDITAANEVITDVVAEKTGAAGVTIDGLTIKDSKIIEANCIDSAQYINDSIDMAHLSTGLFQLIGDYNEYTVVPNDYVVVWRGRFVCPREPTSLTMLARAKQGSGNGNIRLGINAVYGADVGCNDQQYTWVQAGTVSVSGLTPATSYEITIQLKRASLQGFTIFA